MSAQCEVTAKVAAGERCINCHYAGGRTMNTALLQDTFQSLLTPAKQLQQQYLPQMEHKAQSLDMGQVMSLVRGV